jgi:hypothetical protein
MRIRAESIRRPECLYSHLLIYFLEGNFYFVTMDDPVSKYNDTNQMKDNYIYALTNGGRKCIFSRIAELFAQDPDTDTGLGSHYIVDLLNTNGDDAGARLLSIVCENQDIPVADFKNRAVEPIRDSVKYILDLCPPRCAILLDTRDNHLMLKVRNRLAKTQCDLRYRRVVFCLTDQDMPSGTSRSCIQVPGTTDDKLTMLLYHVPTHIRDPDASANTRLRQIAESMIDYTLFEPRVWRDVCVNGTLDEFISTAFYQIARRVRQDPGLDDDKYPSFELEWRRSLATRLQSTMLTPPTSVCPRIHQVIPIGVSPSDAIQALEVAIPKDIENPYAVTVRAAAVDDRCGSIAITEPMNHTVVTIICMINPGILVDVCRELRVGHKVVVSEMNSMNQKLYKMDDTIRSLVQRLSKTKDDTDNATDKSKKFGTCTKTGCQRIVTKRFKSGKRQKQCSTCLSYVSVSIAKHKTSFTS